MTQMNGRPRKVWLNELGYSSDTRYMDKVIEKNEQHAELCKLLAAEEYDVMLLPVVLWIAGTLFKSLDLATKEMDIPIAKKRNCTASSTYTAYTVYKTLCSNNYSWKGRSQPQKQGKR
jgi:hypothetical protein